MNKDMQIALEPFRMKLKEFDVQGEENRKGRVRILEKIDWKSQIMPKFGNTIKIDATEIKKHNRSREAENVESAIQPIFLNKIIHGMLSQMKTVQKFGADAKSIMEGVIKNLDRHTQDNNRKREMQSYIESRIETMQKELHQDYTRAGFKLPKIKKTMNQNVKRKMAQAEEDKITKIIEEEKSRLMQQMEQHRSTQNQMQTHIKNRLKEKRDSIKVCKEVQGMKNIGQVTIKICEDILKGSKTLKRTIKVILKAASIHAGKTNRNFSADRCDSCGYAKGDNLICTDCDSGVLSAQIDPFLAELDGQIPISRRSWFQKRSCEEIFVQIPLVYYLLKLSAKGKIREGEISIWMDHDWKQTCTEELIQKSGEEIMVQIQNIEETEHELKKLEASLYEQYEAPQIVEKQKIPNAKMQ